MDSSQLHRQEETDTLEALPSQVPFYRAPARFGNIPVDDEPKGWDRRQGFRKLYPRIDLPTQIVERVSLGATEPHEPNRLIWGDNLHVMRHIPNNTIDLIYIDPPFFSGRYYNVLWRDDNEMRSFNDIWEGGLDGYLIWLNARLYEMKRILKPTGSIYVHCDWHASHYIKVEMDKIFGYENFLNEIVWHYGLGGFRTKSHYPRKHDILLLYKKGPKANFNVQRGEPTKAMLQKYSHIDEEGNRYMLSYGKRYYLKGGKPFDTVWEKIPAIAPTSGERIGYPTQKPEKLLARLIKTSSSPGDLVADFFVGGGTTAAVAQGLGRRFIVCDQSRVAVAVTAERLKQASMKLQLEDHPRIDFTVEQWGIYEADGLSEMPAQEFREFVLSAYGARRSLEARWPNIHGWHNQFPIWVGRPGLKDRAEAEDVYGFAKAIRQTEQYRQANLRDGEMLAWGFRSDAVDAAEELRSRESVDINFVRISQVRIGDDEFRRHVIRRSTDRADYSGFLTFVQQPVVDVGWRELGNRTVTFDAGDTVTVNPGAELINVQWDFNHDGERFVATPGYSLQRDKKSNRPELRVTHKFSRSGVFRVACKVQDSRGGEGMWTGELSVW